MATVTLDYNPRMARKSLDILKKKDIKKEHNTDFWTTLSCEQQEDIELGISDIDKNETVDYELFMSKYRQ
jgi:hypothetical protein